MKLIRVCLLVAVVFGYLANAQYTSMFYKAQRPQEPKKPNEQRPGIQPRPGTQQRPSTQQKPSTPQKPSTQQVAQTKPQNPQRPKPVIKPNEPVPHYQSCEVDPGNRVPCGVEGVSRDECEALSCCHDGSACYFGRGVTVQCTKNGFFIVVVSKDVTLPNIDMDSILFYGSGDECLPVATSSSFLVYVFPVTACGTVQKDDADTIVYENKMVSTFEIIVGDRGTITRDTTFEVTFEARYTGISYETVVIEVNTVPSPLPASGVGPMTVALYLGSGQCTGKGCVEEDVAFNSYYAVSDYPIVKVLRENVYVEVAMLDRTDPNIVLTLGRCWVTADPSAFSHPQWDLLIDGCPNRDDRYLTRLLDTSSLEFPGHSRRFAFKMFTFMTQQASDPKQKVQSDSPPILPMDRLMYIHCNTEVCIPMPGNVCEPRCLRKRREVVASAIKNVRRQGTIASSQGIRLKSA